jgi:hypothetical protein
MKRPILLAGKLSEEKKRARMREGIPALNMRRERRVMIMYASRPVACRLETPRKLDSREKKVGGGILKIKNFDRNPACVERSIGDNLEIPQISSYRRERKK